MTDGDSLTGRDSELSIIRRALSGTGNHSGVVIIGAAGVGKTRLAREVLASAHASGDDTTWIVGTESARRIPLGAFSASLPDVMSDPLSTVRRLINSFDGSRHRRRLMGVDDAHLLDKLSAHVVHQLAQSEGVRLMVTLRSGGGEPDAITALWKDDLLVRLDLEPLSPGATRRVIETMLGGQIDARSAQRFISLTGGNALFLRQLVKDQVAAGRIQQVAGVWMWDDNVAVSPSIQDIVGRQLSRLAPGVARVVDTLSQCEPLAVDVLCDLAHRGDLEVAEQLHLVTVERSGSTLMARLSHPLFGELRRATAGEMRLSQIRGCLAQRLAKDADADMRSTVRRGLLTLESDLAPEPDLLLESARFAMTLLDLELADRFASAAAAAGVAEAAGLRAMNLVLLGRGEEAEAVLREMAEDIGRPDKHHWSTVRAANLIWMLGRPREASSILDRLSATHESAAEVAERAAIEACVDVVLARCASAGEKARTALRFGGLTDFHALMASVALVMALGALGQVDDITEVANVALERTMASYQTSHMRFWFGSVYARACRLTGRIDECLHSARQLADSAKDVPGLAYANLAFLLGHAELARGAVPDAIKLLREALAMVQKHGVTTGLRPACCFALAEAHAKLGQPDAANEALGEAHRAVPRDYLFMQTALSVATGWALAAGGRLGEAITTVQAAAKDARDRNQPTHELACLQAAAQWGDVSGIIRTRELADMMSIPLANAVAKHTESLRASDGEGLLAASAEYRAIGDCAAAGDVAAQAAVVFGGAQRRTRGLYAAALAGQLAEECGGLRTLALRTPMGVPFTGRQREVIEFVVAGLSNREIADRLVMSVRTVEGHVYRACQRVGAKSREDLAAILRANPAARPVI